MPSGLGHGGRDDEGTAADDDADDVPAAVSPLAPAEHPVIPSTAATTATATYPRLWSTIRLIPVIGWATALQTRDWDPWDSLGVV